MIVLHNCIEGSQFGVGLRVRRNLFSKLVQILTVKHIFDFIVFKQKIINTLYLYSILVSLKLIVTMFIVQSAHNW